MSRSFSLGKQHGKSLLPQRTVTDMHHFLFALFTPFHTLPHLPPPTSSPATPSPPASSSLTLSLSICSLFCLPCPLHNPQCITLSFSIPFTPFAFAVLHHTHFLAFSSRLPRPSLLHRAESGTVPLSGSRHATYNSNTSRG